MGHEGVVRSVGWSPHGCCRGVGVVVIVVRVVGVVDKRVVVWLLES
jgi:hypothetical protein